MRSCHHFDLGLNSKLLFPAIHFGGCRTNCRQSYLFAISDAVSDDSPVAAKFLLALSAIAYLDSTPAMKAIQLL